MYSPEWFETFAAHRPAADERAELDAITSHIPRADYPRVIDIGCGVGHIAGPLAARGYAVTGVDISLAALSIARDRAPGPRYVAIDQRHIDRMRWEFDAVLVIWNSLGFVDRAADLETVAGLTAVLRRGGKVLFDMYHPDWMRNHELPGESDSRKNISVRHWVHDRRCLHEIRYASGRTDDIQFELYRPEELCDLARAAGLDPGRPMTWWTAGRAPTADVGRYQVICTRLA